MDIEAMIGLGAAPLLLIALTAHIKKFTRAVGIHLGVLSPVANGTPWPLVLDVLAVAWTLMLWRSGLLPEGVEEITTAVLVGLALGVAAGTLRDQTVSRLNR